MPYRKVTVPSRDDLAALIDKLTAQQIADKFGVSRRVIESWKCKYELRCQQKGRPRPHIDETQLRAMVDDGSSLAPIAKHFGCSIVSVVIELERLGIRTRGQIAAAGGAQDHGQAVVHVVPSASALRFANPFRL